MHPQWYLLQGDVTSSKKVDKYFKQATVVFINNLKFDATLNEHIKVNVC